MEKVKYKTIEDHIYIETVPVRFVGYDNPQVTVKVKRDMEDWKQVALKREIGDALLRWATITSTPLKSEIKL